MLHQVRGIVLHHLRYSDTSVIAKIYTNKFGLQSYLVKGVGSSKAKIKLAMFECLNLLEMVVYYRERKNLQTIRELHPAHFFTTLHTDIRKSTLALFINEVISKSIKEEESNPALFDFLFQMVLDLDDPDFFTPDFHLRFMLKFSKFLGFEPRKNHTHNSWFNLREGIFEDRRSDSGEYIAPEFTGYLNDLLCMDNLCEPSFSIPPSARAMLLNRLIHYYRLHIPEFGELKTPEVLHEILSA